MFKQSNKLFFFPTKCNKLLLFLQRVAHDYFYKINPTELEYLLSGNKESLRKLLEQSGVKSESSPVRHLSLSATDSGENPSFLYYKGALLDIESLMQRLERSEKSRTALEKNLKDLTDELSEGEHFFFFFLYL